MGKKWLLLCCFLFCVSTAWAAKKESWIQEQIQEDLQALVGHPVSSRDLLEAFKNGVLGTKQTIYFQIRRGRVSWELSKGTDAWRTPFVFAYFERLAKEHELPDTDFILFMADGVDSSSHFPLFTFSKKGVLRNVILFPDFEMMWEIEQPKKHWERRCDKWSKKTPWHLKKDSAFFRGADTGMWSPENGPFSTDRSKVVLFSYHHPELVDATFSQILRPECGKFLQSLGKSVESATVEDHFLYKYLLDIDGNYSAYSRCRWILFSNCTLVKMASPFTQWYYKALRPWAHYVPIKSDLSDLKSTLRYLIDNDRKAQKIALKGQRLAKRIFTKEMVDRYVVELLTEYAKWVTVDTF